eukprot:gene8045-9453_t
MGKLSIESLVANTAEGIRVKQEIAKKTIVALISNSQTSEPSLYEFLKEIQKDDADDKEWIIKLSEKFNHTSSTANKILAVRRELCQSIQADLDCFRETVNQDTSVSVKQLNINSSPIFAPLYCPSLCAERQTPLIREK